MELLNILLRTSCRPRGFSRMMSCIESQTNKNIKVYISYDNEQTYDYVSKYAYKIEHQLVKVSRDPKARSDGFFNLYFNDLKNAVSDGYIYHVDDDDVLPNDKVFETISNICTNPEKLYIFRMQYYGRILPGSSFRKSPTHGDISTQCFVYHSKYKQLVNWCDVYSADFNFIRDMYNAYGSNRVEWIDKVVYVLNKHGNGRKLDI